MFDDLKYNSSEVGQIAEKHSRPQIENVLHIVLKFQFDRTCFQGGEVSANFGAKVE